MDEPGRVIVVESVCPGEPGVVIYEVAVEVTVDPGLPGKVFVMYDVEGVQVFEPQPQPLDDEHEPVIVVGTVV